jgi:hypothetical protein
VQVPDEQVEEQQSELHAAPVVVQMQMLLAGTVPLAF